MKLAAVRQQALALPEATEAPHFDLVSFRIRGKIFATASPDGGTLHLFVSEDEREKALALEPEFIEPLLWGGKVRGLRIVLARAKPSVVNGLLRKAWLNRAPKRLVADLQQ